MPTPSPITELPDNQAEYDIRKYAVLRAFLNDDEHKLIGLMGPFGSGKSSAAGVKLIEHASALPPWRDGTIRSRYIVVRNTYRELADTTIKTFFHWFPPNRCGEYRESKQIYLLKGQGEHGPFDAEILFRALDRPDHIGHLLSVEFTGGWVNEAREVPWELIRVLFGRAGRYPPKDEVGAFMKLLVLDTNAPDTQSDWYKFFETDKKPKLAAIYKQPSARGPKAENLDHLQNDYYSDLVQILTEEEAKVYIDGEYGFIRSGRAVYPAYKDSIHCREFDFPVPGIEIYRGWDFGLCYDDQTEVLTESGWRFFCALHAGDKVATRNPETGQCEYHVPKFGIDRWYEGEMLEWDSPEVNMCVTPEHLVACRDDHHMGALQWKSADWLSQHNTGHWRVDVTSSWMADGWKDSRYFDMEASVFAAFMGLYLSEGSVERKGNSYRISVYQNERSQEMQAILDGTERSWKWTGQSWRVTDNELGAWLMNFGHARDKRVPREIAQMPAEHIERFVSAYTAGDGHVRTRENGAIEHTLFTMSERMAADMQELAQKLGWTSSVRIQRGRMSHLVEGATVRAIQSSDGYVVTFKKGSKTAGLHAKHFRRKHYAGRIYCVNVPYHTLYVRRGGRPHWNGNTPACVFFQLLPTGQVRIGWELCAERAGIDAFSDVVLRVSREHMGSKAKYIDIGDPAGEAAAQTDERSCFDILRGKGIDIRGGESTVQIRIESVDLALRTLLDNGEPQLLVHPRCAILRKGFAGGYQYKRLLVRDSMGEMRYTDAPDKNRYSHISDALNHTLPEIFGDLLRDRTERLGSERTQQETALSDFDPHEA